MLIQWHDGEVCSLMMMYLPNPHDTVCYYNFAPNLSKDLGREVMLLPDPTTPREPLEEGSIELPESPQLAYHILIHRLAFFRDYGFQPAF